MKAILQFGPIVLAAEGAESEGGIAINLIDNTYEKVNSLASYVVRGGEWGEPYEEYDIDSIIESATRIR